MAFHLACSSRTTPIKPYLSCQTRTRRFNPALSTPNISRSSRKSSQRVQLTRSHICKSSTLEFSYSSNLRTGEEFKVELMTEQDIKVTGVCLARSFASSNKYATVGDVGEYLEGMLNRSPAGVVLVGKICKPDGTRTVAGCASISFDPSTRDEYPALTPDADAAYLCNIAVMPGHRRKGIASQLMDAAERMSAERGVRQMQLHVALSNDAAMRLYQKRGFAEKARDGILAGIGGNRRALLFKDMT